MTFGNESSPYFTETHTGLIQRTTRQSTLLLHHRYTDVQTTVTKHTFITTNLQTQDYRQHYKTRL